MSTASNLSSINPNTQVPEFEDTQNELPEDETPLFELPQPEVSRGGFFKLSHDVFSEPRLQALPGDTFRLFLWLSSRAWRFETSDGSIRASVSFIAAKTGLSHANISRSLKILRDKDLIRLANLDYKNGNTWTIHPIACGVAPIKVPQIENVAPSKRVRSPLRLRQHPPQLQAENKNLKNSKELNKETDSQPEKGGMQLIQEFSSAVDIASQEKMIEEYILTELNRSFIPSKNILRLLVAAKWKEDGYKSKFGYAN